MTDSPAARLERLVLLPQRPHVGVLTRPQGVVRARDSWRGVAERAAPTVGPGRVVTLYHRSSTPYQIH
jgi:hypothetical protein